MQWRAHEASRGWSQVGGLRLGPGSSAPSLQNESTGGGGVGRRGVWEI